jgi:hypothetical protein
LENISVIFLRNENRNKKLINILFLMYAHLFGIQYKPEDFFRNSAVFVGYLLFWEKNHKKKAVYYCKYIYYEKTLRIKNVPVSGQVFIYI